MRKSGERGEAGELTSDSRRWMQVVMYEDAEVFVDSGVFVADANPKLVVL